MISQRVQRTSRWSASFLSQPPSSSCSLSCLRQMPRQHRFSSPLWGNNTRRAVTTQQHVTSVKGTIPSTLLSRDPSRPLPSLASLSVSRKWARTIPIFAVVLTVSVLAIFNYQKTSSPVVTAILYSLRTNPKVRAVLGDEVYFASKWAWVGGEINLVQGRIDTKFDVKGTKDQGTVKFIAARHGGRAGSFSTQEWSLHIKGTDKRLDLLEGMGDPLEGQVF